MSHSDDLPRSIDDVIVRLDAIVSDAIARGSRLGYFAALYNRVTRAVRDAIRSGRFDDNARMERLDVAFAGRYLDAYDTLQHGREATLSWQAAFGASARADLSILQHLFAGMNAHINLDLGIAAAEVAPGALDTLEPDFTRINDILASLLPVVENQLRGLSPVLDGLSTVADRLDEIDDRVAVFSIEKARRGAWLFAQTLAALPPIARPAAIAVRDARIALLCDCFVAPGPGSVLLGGPDPVDVAAHVRLLAQGDTGIAGV